MSFPSRHNNPNYGRGEHSIEAPASLTPPTEAQQAALCQMLLDTFRAPSYSPPRLPKVGMQIMQLSRSPDVDLQQVLKLLEKDPLLAGAVLRVARSPAFAGSAEIVSLHQALMRLGLKTMADIVLQASMTMEMFRAPGFEKVMEALSRHSTVTAHLTRYICSASDIPGDYAFLCGLMHDVGIAASLAVVTHRKKRPPPFEKVWPSIEMAHPDAGAIVARIWNLPPQVVEVIKLHHRIVHQQKAHRIAAAVSLADGFAVEAGFGYGDDSRDVATAQVERAAKLLRIDSGRLERLREQTHHLAKNVET